MGEEIITSHNGIPLVPLQWSWLHVCLAVSCNRNHILAVVNGVKIEDKQFSKAEGIGCPKSLRGNLVLQKGLIQPGVWAQNKGRVTNLNIFSRLMHFEEMLARTKGKECG